MSPKAEVQRAIVTARLKPGSRDAATELVRSGPPYDLEDAGFLRHGVYLGPTDVIFFWETGGRSSGRRVPRPE